MKSLEIFGHGHTKHNDLSLTSEQAEEIARKNQLTVSRGIEAWYFWKGREAAVKFGQQLDKKEVKRMLSLQKKNKQVTSNDRS